ncbi:hypothetical protein E0H86_07055 [Acinetobacter sp. ANC 4635]|uniref:hypothetical protein n=1 Tax=Acinetobacter sp. ANC 4635 TaxID=2529846 RepID=UPI00103FE224|nr:hypothetical protein [Acinetobacter sp. ANC 4635]TCB32166.1 hypothetical protein E0H86_07055 [Acinetobacter sp. ANC 4635]
MILALAILRAIWRFFCACFWWVLSNKRWALIIVLVIYGAFQTWQSNSLANKLNSADAKCAVKVNKAKDELKQYKADQKEAIETANDKANQASADYEQLKATQQVKIQTVRDTVQKIVERPVYRNVCFDNDGLQQLGKAINLGKTKLSSELDGTVPKPDNSE